MRYLGTSFSLVLGAWRLCVAIDLEDDDDESLRRSPACPSDSGREAAPRDVI
ncbi:MAG: hypothetical protein ACLPYS_11095 [Vulcanimicrobiaceae bacterium]